MIFVAAILILPALEQVAAYKVSIGREDHPLARPKDEWSTDDEIQPNCCFPRGVAACSDTDQVWSATMPSTATPHQA
jgi:hypothetical protein